MIVSLLRAARRKRVRTPTLLQAQTTECGVASLAMILAYHGRRVTLEELRNATGVSREGNTIAELVRAAGPFGLATRAFRAEPEQLPGLGFPLIAHMRFVHFVVVEGMDERQVFVNDPGLGRHALPRSRFSEEFTGIALTLTPTPSFQRGGQPFATAACLLQRLRPWKRPLALVLIASVLLVMPAILVAALLQQLLDAAAVGRIANPSNGLPAGFAGAGFVVAGFAGTFVLRLALGWLRAGCLARLQREFSLTRAPALLRHLLHLPFAFFAYRLPGNLHGLVRANDGLAAVVCGRLLNVLVGALSLPVLAAALLWYDALIGAVVLGVAGACWLVGRWVAEGLACARRRYRAAQEATFAHTADNIAHLETFKTGGMDHEFFAGLAGAHAAALSAKRPFDVLRGRLALLPEIAEGAGLLAVLGLGGLAVLQGRLTVGTLAALLWLSASLLTILRDLLADDDGDLEFMRQTLPRLAEVERLTVGGEETSLAVGHDFYCAGKEAGSESCPTERLEGALVLRHVSFGYARHKAPLIQDVSLEVRPGSQLAIAGPTAGGKSTLAGLLAGLHRPWSGEIELAGRPLNTLPRSIRARSLAWVDRGPFLFEGTVRENLCLWDPGLAEADLRAAVRDACLDDVLAKRDGDLDARVAPDGVNFSGGQRMRLEIARALARNPSVLILDGALDALEPELEHRVRANLRRRGCAVVVISQRASTVQTCDEIVFIDKGRLVSAPSGQAAPASPPGTRGKGECVSEQPSEPACRNEHGAQLAAAFSLVASASSESRAVAEIANCKLQIANCKLERTDDGLPAGLPGLYELARRARLRLRRVRLAPADWWRQKHGPLLGFWADGHRPVALLPVASSYVAVDPAGSQREPLTSESATRLERTAFMLYRRLADDGIGAEPLLRAAARGGRKDSLTAGGASLALALLSVAAPLTIVLLFRHIVPSGDHAGLGVVVTVLLAATAVTVLLHHLQFRARQRLENRIEHNLLTALWDRLVRLPVPLVRRFSMEELARRANCIREVLSSLGGVTSPPGAGAAMLVPCGALLVWLNPLLATVALALLLPAVLVPVLLARRGMVLKDELFRQAVRNHEFLVGILHAIGRLRVTGSEQRAADRWEQGYRAEKRLENRLGWQTALGALCRDTYSFGALAALIGVALSGAGQGFNAGGFLAFLLAFRVCLSSAEALGASAAARVQARPQLRLLEPLLTAPVEPGEGLQAPAYLRGAVDVRQLTFRYDESTVPALSAVSLHVEPGEFVAVVGPSGSGKSTLLRLLLGFERPQQGEVFFDDTPLASYDLPALRAWLGAVLQEDRLWPATLRFNLSGHAPHDLSAVWQAARIAAIDEEIRRLPMGMQTLLDESKLSTGQKQRVLIAARLLRQPRVLLLDEATAAFDEDLQDEVIGNLKALGITVICVTHRASTVTHADRVVVLEAGRVVQSGRPTELLAQDGPLARLYVDLVAASTAPGPSSRKGLRPPETPAMPADRTVHLYRRAALERLESPYDLDELVTLEG